MLKKFWLGILILGILSGVVMHFAMGNGDSDGDGLSRMTERMLGTKDYRMDSDGDGLSDFQEYQRTGTDPRSRDSDGNGVSDGDEDEDEDGLTNLQEILTDCDPLFADTDGDRIKDGQEVLEHGTNPLVKDTDGDGLSDREEIDLELHPRSPATDGTPDGERTFSQEIGPEAIAQSLLQENPVVPYAFGNLQGSITQRVKLKEERISAMTGHPAMVGKAVQLESQYPENAELWIGFRCGENDPRKKFYMICRYEDNRVVPCETVLEGNTIQTRAFAGQYFIFDVENLLSALPLQ